MKINIQINVKVRYMILALLLSMYASFGIILRLLKTNPNSILKRFEHKTFLTRMYANLMISLKSLRGYTLLYGMVALFLFVLLLFVFSQRYKIWDLLINGIVALAFSVCQWFAVVFTKSDTWDIYLKNEFLMTKNVISITAWWIIAFAILLALNYVVKNVFHEVSKGDLTEEDKKKVTKKKVLFAFFCSAAVIFIFWLPYYIILWPGSLHGDAPSQILQYYHFPVSFQGRWISDGVNTIYTNDHPFIMTIILGKFIDLGRSMGNMLYGFAILTAIQMILFIIGFSVLIASFYYFRVPKKLVVAATLLYAIVPVFPMYAQLIGGDVWLSLVFVYFMIGIIWIFQTKGEVLKSKRFIFFEFCVILLMGMVKNQGIYIAVVMILIIAITYYRRWKGILIGMILPIILFKVVYMGFVFDICHVGPVGRQEALSFFFQQTARCVTYHTSEITEEEKEAIDKILDYENLPNYYDIGLSDGVKSTFKDEATSEDMKNYFKTWFKMGLKYPIEYLQAFVGNTWMYYGINYFDGDLFYYKLSTVRFYVSERSTWTEGVIPEDFLKTVDYQCTEKQKENREIFNSYLRIIATSVPILNWFMIPGCITWMMITSYVVMWTRKNYKMIFTFLPLFLVFGVCLLSPKNGNLRYLLPTCMMMPSMLTMALGGRRNI